MTDPSHGGRRRTTAAVLTTLVATAGGAAGVAWAAANPPPPTPEAGGTVAGEGASPVTAAPAQDDLRRLADLRDRLERVRRDIPRLLAGISRLPAAAGGPVRGDAPVATYVPPSAPRLPSPQRAAAPAPAPAPAPPPTHTSTGASGAG